jgi:hypothetical protein
MLGMLELIKKRLCWRLRDAGDVSLEVDYEIYSL